MGMLSPYLSLGKKLLALSQHSFTLCKLTIWVLIRQPGVLDVVVVFVAPLDALLSTEVLVRAGTLLRVAHLVVKSRARAISTAVGRPAYENKINHLKTFSVTKEYLND